MAAALSLLACVAVAAAYFVAHPGPTPLDRLGSDVVPVRHNGGVLVSVTRLGSPAVLLAGAVGGGLCGLRRGRARALALLAGPLLAAVVCDWILKPVVGRRFEGALSFPSGTVAVVAALATVGVIVTPPVWRWATGVVGGVVTAAMILSVVALRWHYPTDALVGLVTGVGVVLLVDAVVRAADGAPPGPPRPDRHTGARRHRATGLGTGLVVGAGRSAGD